MIISRLIPKGSKTFKQINKRIDTYHLFISNNYVLNLLGVWTVTVAGYAFLIGQIDRYSYWSWNGFPECLIKIILTTFPVSPLFVPSNQLEWINKAENSEADGLILDLEDSVPTSEKNRTRKGLAEYLSSEEIKKPFFIRTNPLSSSDGEEDIALFQNIFKNFLGLIIPKIESPKELSCLKDETKVILLIETPLALEALSSLTKDKKVIGLALGGADLSAELGSDMSWDALLMARSMIVMQASKLGLLTIDSPFMDINDENLLAEEILFGKLSKSGGIAYVDLVDSEISVRFKENNKKKEKVKN